MTQQRKKIPVWHFFLLLILVHWFLQRKQTYLDYSVGKETVNLSTSSALLKDKTRCFFKWHVDVILCLVDAEAKSRTKAVCTRFSFFYFLINSILYSCISGFFCSWVNFLFIHVACISSLFQFTGELYSIVQLYQHLFSIQMWMDICTVFIFWLWLELLWTFI